MDFSAVWALVFVLVACFMVLIFLSRKDAFKSMSRMGDLLHQAQEDAKDRERGIWQRANTEVMVTRRQLEEAHKLVLKAKIPLIQPKARQPDFPFQDHPRNSRTATRANVPADSATMG